MFSRSIKFHLTYWTDIRFHKKLFFQAHRRTTAAINQFINMNNDINHWHRSNICSCLQNMRTASSEIENFFTHREQIFDRNAFEVWINSFDALIFKVFNLKLHLIHGRLESSGLNSHLNHSHWKCLGKRKCWIVKKLSGELAERPKTLKCFSFIFKRSEENLFFISIFLLDSGKYLRALLRL